MDPELLHFFQIVAPESTPWYLNAQNIINSVLAALTFGAVLVAVRSTKHAHKMARLTSVQHSIEFRPMLVLASKVDMNLLPEKEEDATQFRMEYLLKNVGKIPVRYRVLESRLDEKALPVTPKTDEEAICIFPTCEIYYRTDYVDIPKGSADKIDSTMYIKLEYWALDNATDKRFWERKYKIMPGQWRTNFLWENAN